jgi:hypothetical protein
VVYVPKFRTIAWLRYATNMSFREIGQTLGQLETTAKTFSELSHYYVQGYKRHLLSFLKEETLMLSIKKPDEEADQ